MHALDIHFFGKSLVNLIQIDANTKLVTPTITIE